MGYYEINQKTTAKEKSELVSLRKLGNEHLNYKELLTSVRDQNHLENTKNLIFSTYFKITNSQEYDSYNDIKKDLAQKQKSLLEVGKILKKSESTSILLCERCDQIKTDIKAIQIFIKKFEEKAIDYCSFLANLHDKEFNNLLTCS